MGEDADGPVVLDPRELIRRIAAERASGTPAGTIASRFHAAIAGAAVEASVRAASEQSTELVVLSGGVFQNRRLLVAVADGLAAAGLRVLIPEKLPANDGGISYGQAAVAASLLSARP